jgi:hypothetical protein
MSCAVLGWLSSSAVLAEAGDRMKDASHVARVRATGKPAILVSREAPKQAGVVKLADAPDSKSGGVHPP